MDLLIGFALGMLLLPAVRLARRGWNRAIEAELATYPEPYRPRPIPCPHCGAIRSGARED